MPAEEKLLNGRDLRPETITAARPSHPGVKESERIGKQTERFHHKMISVILMWSRKWIFALKPLKVHDAMIIMRDTRKQRGGHAKKNSGSMFIKIYKINLPPFCF